MRHFLFEDFVLKSLLAEHALQFCGLGEAAASPEGRPRIRWHTRPSRPIGDQALATGPASWRQCMRHRLQALEVAEQGPRQLNILARWHRLRAVSPPSPSLPAGCSWETNPWNRCCCSKGCSWARTTSRGLCWRHRPFWSKRPVTARLPRQEPSLQRIGIWRGTCQFPLQKIDEGLTDRRSAGLQISRPPRFPSETATHPPVGIFRMTEKLRHLAALARTGLRRNAANAR